MRRAVRASLRPMRRLAGFSLVAALLAAVPRARGEAPADAEAAISRARLYAEAGQVHQALAVLKPFRRGPAATQVTVEAGRLRFAAGDYEGAAAEYRAVLALLPDHPVVERNLLLALYRGFRDDEARELLAAMGPRVEKMARPLAVRGLLAARAGEQQAAVSDLEAAMALDDDTFAAYELGLLHLAAGDPAAAVAPLAEVVRRQPDHAQGLYNLGQALVRSGELQRGRAAIAEARRLTAARNDLLTRRMRAVALAVRAQEALARGDAAAARRDLEEALELLPGDPGLEALRAAARRAAGSGP